MPDVAKTPALVRQWEAELYPAIKAVARAVGAAIYFADEAGIRSDYHSSTPCTPVGASPVVTVTGRRFSFNMISAVSPRGNCRFMINEGAVTAPVFKEFLKRLMIGATQPVYVVIAAHSIHKSKLVKDYVDSLDGNLVLPSYSVRLNPDAEIWAHVKCQVSKQLAKNKDNMKKLASVALHPLQMLPALAKSIFLQAECRYACWCSL